MILSVQTSPKDCLGQVGCLSCPGVRINAQGYTEPLHHERVEYAWMIKIISQEVVGSVAVHQVSTIAKRVHRSIRTGVFCISILGRNNTRIFSTR